MGIRVSELRGINRGAGAEEELELPAIARSMGWPIGPKVFDSLGWAPT